MRRLYWGSTVLLTGAVIAACGSDSRQGPVAPNQRQANGSVSASRSANGADDDAGANGKIAIRDDCDPNDPSWAPTGGCLLARGDVAFAEFNAELSSPLALSVVGHQAWRNDPSYVETLPGRTIRVRNEGGRTHTFTEVARFGGGKVPPLSPGLLTAPECPASINIPPGDESDTVEPCAREPSLPVLHSPVDAGADQDRSARTRRQLRGRSISNV